MYCSITVARALQTVMRRLQSAFKAAFLAQIARNELAYTNRHGFHMPDVVEL
jgi:hypothetical protein